MRLAIKSLTRRFGASVAVDAIDLDVAAGEVVCLLGPSGCGKSTTLRIAAGVERQDSGVVTIDGVEVSGPRRHAAPEARGVGLMFQDLALFPHLSVIENVAFGVRSRDRLARARAELDRVGLAHAAERYPHEISGGEQQRVALARALAPQPSVMLLDEPFSALDHRLRDQVRDEALALMKESGAAVLLVTHDPDEALRMSDRIALMRDGAIAQMGAPQHVYNYPVDRRAAAFFSDINLIHGVVRDQQTDTPFGRFLTPGLIDGADVEIVIRPQHLRMDVGRFAPAESADAGVAAEGRVIRARFMGAYSLVEAKMAHDGSLLTATQPGVFLPPEGAPIWFSLRRDHCFVFPCSVQSRVAWPYFSAEGSQAAGSAATRPAAERSEAPAAPMRGEAFAVDPAPGGSAPPRASAQSPL